MSRSTFDGVIAAFILFTRLPIWRLITVQRESYSTAVMYWPLVGWVTGGVCALVMLLSASLLPITVSVVLALTCRILLTGALHEDGLADFCDGFGGGVDKERILSIMKDSHIGTYGVIGLIIYFLLTALTLSSLPVAIVAALIFAADPFAKLCAGQLINALPYARAEGAKNKISYSRMGAMQICVQVLCGLLPMTVLACMLGVYVYVALTVPVVVMAMMVIYLRRKIGGYTGDCCGASYLICELSMLITVLTLYNLEI